MPDYKVDYATVTAEYPGVSAVGMDEQVARHLDRALNGITGISKVYTTSTEGRVRSYLELDSQSDTEATLDRIELRISAIPELPAEMDPLRLNRFDAAEQIGRMIVFGPIEREEITSLKDTVADVFRRNEVNRYKIYSDEAPRVLVEVEPAGASDLGLTLGEIDKKIRENLVLPNSFLVTSGQSDHVLVRNRLDGYAGLGQIDLAPEWNGLKLKDIAHFRKAERQQANRNIFPDGQGLFVEFQKGPTENIIGLTNAIEASAADLRDKLPETMTVQLYGMEAYQIRSRIALLAKNGLMGLLFVVLVLYVFVGLQTAIWVGVGLPSAFAVSFYFMYLTGQSINMVSVFTMVIVVGFLVDDSIVVAEGITTNNSTAEGLRRTWFPVFAATLTTVVAFAPILLLTDQIGSYVGAIPWFVCAALAASLIECFILLPNHLHHDRFIKNLPDLPGRQIFGRLYRYFLAGPFKSFLKLIWRIPSLTLASCVVFLLCAATIMSLGAVRFQFWLNPQSNYVFAHITVPSAADEATLEATMHQVWDAAERASANVTRNGGTVIQATFAIIGRHYTRRGADGQREKGSILVELKDLEGQRISARHFLSVWQKELPELAAGIIVEIEEELQGLEGPPISVTLRGETLESVQSASLALANALREVPGIRDVSTNLAGRSPSFLYRVSPMHQVLGIASSDIQRGVFDALNGRYGEEVLQSGEEVNWQVRYRLSDTINETLDTVEAKNNSVSRLSDLVEVSYEPAIRKIRRKEGDISVEVTAHNNSGEITLDETRELISSNIIPGILADYAVKFDQGGHIATVDTTMQKVLLAFALGLGLIYTVLSLTMRSFLTPLFVMSILPFGAAGMVLGHFLLGYTLSLLSIVALIGLFGILVNDAILLFDEIRSRSRTEPDVFMAMHKGYSHRFRAILLTSVTTIAGLLPLLLETSYQAQFLIPIAVTISFGLGVSTVISFFLVPAIVAAFVPENKTESVRTN